MRWNYIHTFIYERSFLACQTFQVSNFTSVYTQLTSQNAHTRSYKATYHDEDTIYYWCIINSWEYNKFNSPNEPFIFSNMKRAPGYSHELIMLYSHELIMLYSHELITYWCCDRVVLKTFLSIKCPATLRWALSWENTDDFCHIYTIYIYIQTHILQKQRTPS